MVIVFSLGTNTLELKDTIANGADEVDMVSNVGALALPS